MPSTYSGDPSAFPPSLQIPSDGDLKFAASVNAALEGLADRTAHLFDRITGGQDAGTFLNAELTGNTLFSGTGTITIGSGQVVTCDGDVEFTNGSTCQFDPGSSLLIGGSCSTVGVVTCTFYNVHVPNTLDVDGATTLDGAVTCSSTLTANGSTTLAGSVGASGVVTYTNRVVLGAGGHLVRRYGKSADFAGGLNIDHTLVITSDPNVISAQGVNITGNRNWTLSNNNAVKGDEFEVSMYGATMSTFVVNLKDGHGNLIVQLGDEGTSGNIFKAKCVHNGTDFELFDYSLAV